VCQSFKSIFSNRTRYQFFQKIYRSLQVRVRFFFKSEFKKLHLTRVQRVVVGGRTGQNAKQLSDGKNYCSTIFSYAWQES